MRAIDATRQRDTLRYAERGDSSAHTLLRCYEILIIDYAATLRHYEDIELALRYCHITLALRLRAIVTHYAA